MTTSATGIPLAKKVPKLNISECILMVCQDVILKYKFSIINNQMNQLDYRLSKFIEICFKGVKAESNTRILCENLSSAFKKSDFSPYNYSLCIAALSKVHSELFLNNFLGGEEKIDNWKFDILYSENEILLNINEDVIKKWCESNLTLRCHIVASALKPCQNISEDNRLRWTNLALWIMERNNNPVTILNIFRESFYPRIWSGSLAFILEKHLCLLTDLKENNNPIIVAWANKEEEKLKENIRREREYEAMKDKRANESFE